MIRSMLRTGTIALAATLGAMSIAEAASIDITNTSRNVIHYVYVSPSAADAWGPDLLGSNVLFPGEYVTVELSPYFCSFDVLTVDEYGYEETTWNYRVC